MLAKGGVDAEVIDLRTIKPMDDKLILESLQKTGKLVVVDGAGNILTQEKILLPE